jgi:prepilin-type N-terminal cleavage/methylation domain-containing protein
MHSSHANPRAHHHASNNASSSIGDRAFTLAELLVVIAIIGILIGLVFTAGAVALRGGKERATTDVIRTLDAAMQAYLDERASLNRLDPIHLAFNPSNAVVGDADATDDAFANDCFPIVDGRAGEALSEPIFDTVGLWMADAQRFPSVKAILDRIPARFVQRYDADVDGPIVSAQNRFPQLTTVVDAWNRPIRLVLPQTDGIWADPPNYSGSRGSEVNIIQGNPPVVLPMVPDPNAQAFNELRSVRTGALAYEYPVEEIRRNWADLEITDSTIITDSDGGRCEGSRPYFYSAGPDGIVGFKRFGNTETNYNTDNIYTNKPRFPRVPD